MKIWNEQEMKDTLEELIDSADLDAVVSALSAVCFEKADHVQSVWQDKALAKAWTQNAKALDKVKISPTS